MCNIQYRSVERLRHYKCENRHPHQGSRNERSEPDKSHRFVWLLLLRGQLVTYETDRRPVGDSEPLLPNQFVEFKTSRIIDSENQDRNFRKFKLIKWWAQSFLGKQGNLQSILE